MAGAIVLDVGSSSGLTSVDLIDRLGEDFAHYYVTDLYFHVPYHIENDVAFFYHPVTGRCIIRSGGFCIAYADCEGSPGVIGMLARQLLERAPKGDPSRASLASMVHPSLKARMRVDRRVTLETFSVLKPWHRPPVDIIKVANVLNEAYFSQAELRTAVENLRAALNPGGVLAATDNRDVERVSLFSRRPDGELTPIEQINGGAEISKLI